MALLLSFRRWWCVVFVGLLLLPTIGLFTPDLPAPARMNNVVPNGWWVRAAEKLDPFINDNYGLRGTLMTGHAAYGRAFQVSRDRPVLIGRHERMFYTAEQTLDQTLGRVLRKPQLEQMVSVTARMREEVAKWGGKLVVAIPPNSQTIYGEDLPDWTERERRRPTEYDFIAEAMPKAGVPFVDMRPALTAAKSGGAVYFRTDTHWNRRGALIGFNAVMAAAGYPQLEVPEADALGPVFRMATGDLSRFLGETNPTGDTDYEWKPAMIKPDTLKPITGVMPASPPNDPFEPYAYETGHAGPRVLVVGDSFTQHFWPGLLAHGTSAFGWMHHRSCKFDFSAVERFKPNLLIYIPVERSMPCAGTPAHLDMAAGKAS
ncbi:hypothetical protein GCM10007301_51390 [Azorhizobium oxalatiphilum]|uniref:AlgX/AlgJ SGNH hydrolase-like domain-containing protein n=1 Tax=Azorhizobium oxalatiphilum TaxID=980631 RepID=A0A917CG49_9HYPH|nr:hypothetical protein [Azorhizobium oxalatiphilum]GGF85200.1 hypothetical protein GCM10007301_51390 [Azorhizobium oxalatiphilum]